MSQDIDCFTPLNSEQLKSGIVEQFMTETNKLIDQYILIFNSNIQSPSQQTNDSTILISIKKRLSQSSKIIYTYEMKDLFKDISNIYIGKIQGRGNVFDEFQGKIDDIIASYRSKLILNFSSTANVGNSSTDGKDVTSFIAPSTNFTLNLKFGKNAIVGNIIERAWFNFNVNLGIAMQSKTSNDSSSALAKILNFGSDVNLKANFKGGTSIFNISTLKFIIGASLLISDLGNKKITFSNGDTTYLNGTWMISYNFTPAVWFVLSRSDQRYIFVGYKYEKRFVSGVDGWLDQQLDGAITQNLYGGISIDDFQVYANWLVKSNRITKGNNVQIRIGKFFNF